MNGKTRCKILKEIRKEIAENNDIEYVTSECRHKGDCAGTCPKCEQEVRYLEQEIEKRRKLGKSVAVAGIAAAMAVAGTGCEGIKIVDDTLGGEPLPLSGDIAMPIDNSGIEEVTDGILVNDDDSIIQGKLIMPEENVSEYTKGYELNGDIAITDTENTDQNGEITLPPVMLD